ncbi:hypothetical protein V6N13_026472 [Hibiscus sabdariffa]
MASCRRAKVLINSLRSSFSSTPFLISPTRASSPTISPSFGSWVSSANRAKFSGFSSYSSISQRLGISSKYHCNPFSDGAKRFYFVDRLQVHHFKPEGFRRWFQDPMNAFIVVLLGSGVLITVYFDTPMDATSSLPVNATQGTSPVNANATQGTSPVNANANATVSQPRGLSHDQIWHDLVYASPGRKESQEKGSSSKPTTNHLEGLNWEVLVIDQPEVNAMCLPGGKIVVFTGLLEHFRTDSEIATIIGHEVAHAVARHIAETITRALLLVILKFIVFYCILVNTNPMSALFFRFPFSRRMEVEADYIGLLLLASAGYDPRTAPKVFEKLGQVAKDSTLHYYLLKHPPVKERAQLLAQAQVMEEALTIYRDVVAGRGVEGFL